MSKRILVTGGAGFIGSHLCRNLLEQGHQVVCLDNFYTGCRENVTGLSDSPRFTLLEHDIVQPIKLPIDEIYHLACPASPIYYQRDPVQTWKTCAVGTLHILELARMQGAKLLHTSTSEVYGDPLVHPQQEDYWGHVNPIGLRSCYDEGKRCTETLCFDYRRQYGTDIKIVRIFNTYGPNMHPDDGRVVSNFIMQALLHKPLTIYGTGQQTRSFCYVDDMVAGLTAMMETDKSVSGPINLGNPGEFTMLELAEQVLQLTGSRSELVFCPLPPDDPRQRRPDISRAYHQLGWRPSVELTDGLRMTTAYFRERLGLVR